MIGVAVQVATRTASNDSQIVFSDSLQMIAQNQALYLTSMYASVISNALLAGLAAGLYSTFRIYQPDLARAGAFLLLATAVVSMVAAVAGLALASLAQEFVGVTGNQENSLASSAQAVEVFRAYAGRTGFTFSALSLLAFGGLISWQGPIPKWLGWLGILVGVMMLLIWSESATLLHRIGGTGYLVWLAITGGWLVLRGTRHVGTE